MRKISFKLLTQSQLVKIESNARTFADLQQEIQANPKLKDVIVFGKAQFINNADKAVYGTIPDALLPVGDCLFYVVPTKTDSGCDLPSVEEVEEMSYSELRTLGSKLNHENGASIDLSGKRVDILPRVVEWLEDNTPGEDWSEQEETPESVEEAIVRHAKKIIDLVDEWEAMKAAQEDEVAFKVTYAELEEEANRLASLFK